MTHCLVGGLVARVDRVRLAEFPEASIRFLIAPISPRRMDSARLFSEDLRMCHSVGPCPPRPPLEVYRERIDSWISGLIWASASQLA